MYAFRSEYDSESKYGLVSIKKLVNSEDISEFISEYDSERYAKLVNSKYDSEYDFKDDSENDSEDEYDSEQYFNNPAGNSCTFFAHSNYEAKITGTHLVDCSYDSEYTGSTDSDFIDFAARTRITKSFQVEITTTEDVQVVYSLRQVWQ